MKYLTQKILKETLADYEQTYKIVSKLTYSEVIETLEYKNMQNGLCYYFLNNYKVDTYYNVKFLGSKLGSTPIYAYCKGHGNFQKRLLPRIKFLKSLIK